MATENTSNNNSAVGSSSDNPPADLSYKSQNIIGSKSRKKKDAEFAKDKPSLTERFKNKLQETDTKKLNIILVAIILVVGIGTGVGIIIINNNNNNSPDTTEEAEEDDSDVASALSEQQTADLESEGTAIDQDMQNQFNSARDEADRILNSNPENFENAADVFAKKINQALAKEDVYTADYLIGEADDYFSSKNQKKVALAIYTKVNYDPFINVDKYRYYKRIIELADELGDSATKAKYEPLYNDAKAVYDEFERQYHESEEYRDYMEAKNEIEELENE